MMMPKTTRRQRVQTSLAELGAAIPLVAIALLLTNDRILKSRFHNAVTGKLSDIAICFLLPLLISATLGTMVAWTAERRLWLGAAVTTVVFSALEMSDVVGAGFRWGMAALLGGSIVLTRDPTDLLALAFVPLAIVYGRWRGRRLRPSRRWASAVGVLAVFGGSLALMADSPVVCAKWSAPVAFLVQGDCGANGLIVVEAALNSSRLTITNLSALLTPVTGANLEVQPHYIGTNCPYTLQKGEWEVLVEKSCVNGGNPNPIVDAGAIAEDGNGDGNTDASQRSDADAGAPTVDAGTPGSPCASASRTCHAGLEGDALWFTCASGGPSLPFCRSRLTVFP